MKKQPRTVRLTTPFEQKLPPFPFKEHPRPQMRREGYFCLNGQWDLSVQKGEEETPLGTILVPFSPQSKCSGIGKTFGKKEVLIYHRSFTLSTDFTQETVRLHFDGVDQQASVYLNDTLLGEHIGGYLPFLFDITKGLKPGENHLRVEVRDETCHEIPYGKQRIKRGGMWYTPISGIWQTVWLETLPAKAVERLTFTPALHSITFQVTGGEEKKG